MRKIKWRFISLYLLAYLLLLLEGLLVLLLIAVLTHPR